MHDETFRAALSNLPGRQLARCFLQILVVSRDQTVGFRPVLPDLKMSVSLIDSVSADQQNALKVVRASKPRTRKSSKVTFLFIFSLNGSFQCVFRCPKTTGTCCHVVQLYVLTFLPTNDARVERFLDLKPHFWLFGAKPCLTPVRCRMGALTSAALLGLFKRLFGCFVCFLQPVFQLRPSR